MLSKHYKTLGIPINADIATIKKAYRYKAKQFHPDINNSDTAHDNFIAINNSYHLIINYKSETHLVKHNYSTFQEQREDFINYKYKEWLINELQKSQEKIRQQRAKRKNTYNTKRDRQLQLLSNLFAISIGVFIFIGTLIGINQNESNIQLLAATFTISISIIMIIYPLYIIRKHRT